jgi:hypothetical protein
MPNIYEKLQDVKIMQYSKPQPTPFMFMPMFMRDDEDEVVEPERWTAIYHKTYRKYIVTNNLEESPALCSPGTLGVAVIGFADTLDGIMFTVWEHQVMRGCEHTVLHEIKARQREIAKKVEQQAFKAWEWAKPREEVQTGKETLGFKSKPLSLPEELKASRTELLRRHAHSIMNVPSLFTSMFGAGATDRMIPLSGEISDTYIDKDDDK